MRFKTLMIACFTTGLLTGCAATLEQFQDMGPYDRALMVCDNSAEARAKRREINKLANNVFVLSSDIALRRSILDRGYRTHRECWRQFSTVTVCQGRKDGQIACREERDPNDLTGKEVCKETPVTIDADYEEKKLLEELERLGSAKITLSNLERGYEQSREMCYRRAEQSSPEKAYKYYKNQNEPSNDDVFYKI